MNRNFIIIVIRIYISRVNTILFKFSFLSINFAIVMILFCNLFKLLSYFLVLNRIFIFVVIIFIYFINKFFSNLRIFWTLKFLEHFSVFQVNHFKASAKNFIKSFYVLFTRFFLGRCHKIYYWRFSTIYWRQCDFARILILKSNLIFRIVEPCLVKRLYKIGAIVHIKTIACALSRT